MNIGMLIRLLLCIGTMGLFLYMHIDKQNEITELRLHIPVASKDVEAVRQENSSLQFTLDQLDNPQRLMEIAGRPPFAHLKQPLVDEIVIIEVPR